VKAPARKSKHADKAEGRAMRGPSVFSFSHEAASSDWGRMRHFFESRVFHSHVFERLRSAVLRLPLRLSLPALCCLAALGSDTPAAAADSNALWSIVHGLCVTDEQTLHLPAPCSAVDLQQGWAVLKDIAGRTQQLLIPTARVTGIESAELLSPGDPNYFEAAWRARSFVFARLGRGLPRDDVGLAVNSLYGRSQNQLHIHVDCVRRDVRDELAKEQNRIGRRWTETARPLAGRRYRVMRIAGADFGSVDPFKLLAQTDPTARAAMGRMTLVAVGATFADGKPGFYLLSDRATMFPPDRASGEDLLDHACGVAP
jgi:CDP-diacylglycerol pyrophosphatase